jgi:metal-sulfur cluster biosynthetic enzyme
MDTNKIKEKLHEVKDPELGIDIVTLGLLRGVKIDDVEKTGGVKGAEVLMTLTSPLCPFVDKIIEDVENKLKEIGFENSRVELTFDPPWEPSEDLRVMLGI